MEHRASAEKAPALAIFGENAPRLARLIRIRPQLGARLLLAPRRAVVALSAYLFLAPEAKTFSDEDLARRIDEADPRVLLRAAIPLAPKRLYRALDRAHGVLGREFFVLLTRVMDSVLANEVLSAGPLDDARLRRAEAFLALDPAVVALRGLAADQDGMARCIDALIRFLRSCGVSDVGSLGLGENAGLPAVWRALQAKLDALQAPTPPFQLPARWHILASVGELRAAGKQLENCLHDARHGGAAHFTRLAEGSAVYVMCNRANYVACIRRVSHGLWLIADIAAARNDHVPSGEKEALAAALRAAGVRLLHEHPADAMRRLALRARRGEWARAQAVIAALQPEHG